MKAIASAITVAVAVAIAIVMAISMATNITQNDRINEAVSFCVGIGSRLSPAIALRHQQLFVVGGSGNNRINRIKSIHPQQQQVVI